MQVTYDPKVCQCEETRDAAVAILQRLGRMTEKDSQMLIKDVFSQFLAEQQAKLAPKTYRDYASVIDLFANQLDGYAWNNLDHGDTAYEKAQKQGKSFIDLYEHTHIEENVGEFLDYFVPRKVIAGNEFILKTCPRVMRKLLRWMRDKHLVDVTNDDIKEMCENQLWEDTVRDIGL